MKPCIYCGDLATKHKSVLPMCDDCYGEITDGKIPMVRAETYPSGAGSPMEPNDDDSSPWQDNAIRDMEEGDGAPDQ